MLTRCCNRDNLDVLQGELHKLSEQYNALVEKKQNDLIKINKKEKTFNVSIG